MTSIYTIEFLSERVDTMLKYRGYTRTLINGKFIFGADHPIRKDVIVAYIDDDGEYSKARMQSNIDDIQSAIKMLKSSVKKESKESKETKHAINATSIVITETQPIPSNAVASQSAETNVTTDVQQPLATAAPAAVGGGAKAKVTTIDFPIDPKAEIVTVYVHGYFNKKINELDTGHRVELFRWHDLLIDHSKPRFSRNWKIVDPSYAEMVRGHPMQNKLSLLANDIMARYIGAHVGEIVYYESFERTDGVMIYVPIIRYVMEEADIVEELAENVDAAK